MNRDNLPRTVSEILPLHEEKIEAAIEGAWARLDVAQADGELSASQMRHLLAEEQRWGDDGRLTTRWVFSKYLAAQAAQPRRVGVNLTDAPYTCPCDDLGWYFDDDTRKWSPCARCNQAIYDLWSAGCLRPDHHCERCAPRQRRRAPGASHADETASERAQETVDADTAFQAEIF